MAVACSSRVSASGDLAAGVFAGQHAAAEGAPGKNAKPQRCGHREQLPEISARLGIGLTTLLHHLALLREAGLVTISPGPRGKAYRLRRDGLRELGRGLDSFLLP
jgi:DNA-binding transcriptional ArsR family regulator